MTHHWAKVDGNDDVALFCLSCSVCVWKSAETRCQVTMLHTVALYNVFRAQENGDQMLGNNGRQK